MKVWEAEQYNAHSLSSSGTETDESQAQKKIALTENYSWAGILENARTPSLQEQVQQSLTSLMYQDLLVNICMSGTYSSV